MTITVNLIHRACGTAVRDFFLWWVSVSRFTSCHLYCHGTDRGSPFTGLKQTSNGGRESRERKRKMNKFKKKTKVWKKKQLYKWMSRQRQFNRRCGNQSSRVGFHFGSAVWTAITFPRPSHCTLLLCQKDKTPVRPRLHMDTVMKALRPWSSQTNSLEIRLTFLSRGWRKARLTGEGLKDKGPCWKSDRTRICT